MGHPLPLSSFIMDTTGLHVTARIGGKRYFVRTISVPISPQKLADEAYELQRSYPAAEFFVGATKKSEMMDGDVEDFRNEVARLSSANKPDIESPSSDEA